ncbi:MAG: LutC/YkgG family protein [Peptococcales bacterium]|jgi:L-lactate dehydrogenase complex protein LldG
MNNQAVDWRPHLPQGAGSEELFKSFKEKAEALTVKVIRVATKEEAERTILEEMKGFKVKIAASAPLTLISTEALNELAQKEEIDLCLDLDQEKIEQADFGISEFDIGIAELGTIVQDAQSVHERLVSTLPPTHLAIIETKTIVDTLFDSLQVIQKVYNGNPAHYIAYVTGPSKTADIERVLTIGVHGPSKLIIVCIG